MKNTCFTVLTAAVLTLLAASSARAQSICFWTDDPDAVPVRIYIDQEYIGDVTAAFSSQPLLDTEGALSVDTTPQRHELTAVDKYGRVYKGWPGWIRPRADTVYYLQIRGGQFKAVNRDQYDFVFVNWTPVYYLATSPIRFRGSIPLDRLDPLTDNGLLIGMGVAAVGATAAMGVAASRNWGFPDGRFPYVAVGLGTEYYASLREWRNVAQIKARFGNLGGISLMADAGVASVMAYYPRPYASVHQAASLFTFSVGAGLDYGGFGFSVRYKPAIGESFDTFLNARLQYDWWVDDRFALDFHGGFGVGGYGENGLFDYYDFPFGIGFLIRL
ncbi:MAG: hypothetical protein K5849_05245 [Bacteroidales bacterium]|nr:hypothetical protein [Bacteroidales bacterium]